MAMNQTERHALGRLGQDLARTAFGGEEQNHKAPFDVVDFNLGWAYEVKTMSALSADLKIHISDNSWSRKRRFLRQYGLKGLLIAVVIHSPDHIEIYKSRLNQSIRVNQMQRIGGSA